MLYAVTYDLKSRERDRAGFYEAIKGCGGWWHYLASTWLVETRLSADGIWCRLAPHTDKIDSLLVIRVDRDRQGWLPDAAWKWIDVRSDNTTT